MKSSNSVLLKIFAIVLIGVLLLIPTVMINGLVFERDSTKMDAIREVSSKWGSEQTLTGPFLSIPYYRYFRQYSEKDSATELVQVKEYIHVLPENVVVKGDIQPELRYRGIYEVVVYNSQIEIAGVFNQLNLASLNINPKDILFDQAEFVIGINDLRGIEQQVTLQWNRDSVSFNSGISSADVVMSGIHAITPLTGEDSARYAFSFTLNLKGSQWLHFTPIGKVTDVTVTSNWPDPSFGGAFLPDDREVNEQGFTANWNVLHLNRNYPQMWVGNRYVISESAFGIDLLLPVDNYQKSYRSIRYAILFIGFTFLAFFFIEVMNKVFIHPIQYLLVGLSLVVFYTLLLSISEHLTFNVAFILSALATLVLITLYVMAILRSVKLALFISGLLAILYGFNFTIIQIQDYALLIGSIGIFVILAAVMYFSRSIDWYQINLKPAEKKDTNQV